MHAAVCPLVRSTFVALLSVSLALGGCSKDTTSGPSDPEPWPIGDALCQEGTA